jgi:uncharacterized repeat protein (TIGR03803 family)
LKPRRPSDHLHLIAGLRFLLVGVTALVTSTVSAQTLTTLHSFTGTGDFPRAGLIADAAGALYGTTKAVGAGGNGAVFKLSPPAATGGGWSESLLYTFSGIDGSDPEAGLIFDASGALYGTTQFGGSADAGTVFKLTPPAVAGDAWTESVLFSFTGSDGAQPRGGLIFDASGSLFGTTAGGGAFTLGTVFKLTQSGGAWTETVLYSFTGDRFSDGFFPAAGLIADVSGALYGTTTGGGVANLGTVFKLTPPPLAGGAWTASVLHSFTGNDGVFPKGDLIADVSGALYGTTFAGGAGGNGTVFKLTPPTMTDGAWSESVLYSFTFAGTDGAFPDAGPLADASGALYGTTESGGVANRGTVFKLAPPTITGGAWTESVLHSFVGSDGANPVGGLIADASGALFGTTENGGDADSGTVFKLTLPATFAGVPGRATCRGESIAALAHAFGGVAHATAALGFASVADLQNAVAAFCGN